MKRPTLKDQLDAVRRWNAANEVGCEVTVEMDSGEIRLTKTRSQAWMLGAEPSRDNPGHTAVVSLEGISGGYLLSRVRAKAKTERPL